MAMAGLYENWRSPAGENVPSATIIACAPNALMAELHNRMPVILPPETWPAWLGEDPRSRRSYKRCSRPIPPS